MHGWQSLFLQSRIKSSQLLTSYLRELNTLLEDKKNAVRLARDSEHYLRFARPVHSTLAQLSYRLYV